jgi:hypothetical protein
MDVPASGHCCCLNPVSCNDAGQDLSPGSPQFYQARYCTTPITSPLTILYESEDVHSLDSREMQNIDSDQSPAFFQIQREYFSCSSKYMYQAYLDDDTDIQETKVHSVCIFFLPFSSLSQDDCLNSARHPKLFSLLHPKQAWSVRYYKFQLGLLNTRELLGPRPLANA